MTGSKGDGSEYGRSPLMEAFRYSAASLLLDQVVILRTASRSPRSIAELETCVLKEKARKLTSEGCTDV